MRRPVRGASGARSRRRRAGQVQQYNGKTPILLEPGRAYLLYRTPAKMPYRLIREVTPDERAAWTAKRATALAKDRTRYVRAKAAYDGELASYAEVATLTRVPARLAASPKMSNYFGLLIDRMAPLPGVPAYQCDEATGEPLGGP